jgi:outer membrane protein
MSTNTMFKVLAGLNVVLIGAVIFLAVKLYTGEQIYYVDSSKLLKDYKEMEDARKEYTKKMEAYKANVDTLTSGVQKQIEQYEKESSKMSDREKKLSRELINTRQQELMDYQRAIDQQAREEDQKIMGKVLNNINTYLLEYGKKKNCRYVLVAANGNIAYGNESLDITADVLKELNERYASKADTTQQ